MKNWERELEKDRWYFKYRCNCSGHMLDPECKQDLKSFIQKARKEAVEEVLGEVENRLRVLSKNQKLYCNRKEISHYQVRINELKSLKKQLKEK